MSERPFVYVCSPFRGDVDKNTEQAKEYCREVFKAGYIPLAPHLHFTQFLEDNYPQERAAGMEMGLALLPQCRALVICGDQITEGMKTEIQHAQRLGVEVCALENIPPISTLENYRNDLSNLDNIDIAVSLIEGMTGCRFSEGLGGIFIMPDDNAYLALNVREVMDFDSELYHIHFDAYLRTMGQPMTSEGVLILQQETSRIQTLLSLLESREYVLTPDERKEFIDSIQHREEQRLNAAPLPPIDKDRFWQMIDEARGVTGFWQEMQEPLINTLSKYDEPDIIKFKQIYNEYQNLAYKDKLWAAASLIHGGCSDDHFIDFRAWLIAQGKDVYMNALANPDSLARLESVHDFSVEVSLTQYTPEKGYFYSPDFENFSYVANCAYENKYGADTDIYDVIDKTPLSAEVKADIASEITYAADIDAKWSGHRIPREEINVNLQRLCPELYKKFRGDAPAEKESVIDQIKKSQQAQTSERQPKNTNKKHKVDPDL